MLEHEALGQVFQAATQGLAAGEPASAFTCPLTMEVFRDPVMSPSGLSYERSALLEHLNKVRYCGCKLQSAQRLSGCLLHGKHGPKLVLHIVHNCQHCHHSLDHCARHFTACTHSLSTMLMDGS